MIYTKSIPEFINDISKIVSIRKGSENKTEGKVSVEKQT